MMSQLQMPGYHGDGDGGDRYRLVMNLVSHWRRPHLTANIAILKQFVASTLKVLYSGMALKFSTMCYNFESFIPSEAGEEGASGASGMEEVVVVEDTVTEVEEVEEGDMVETGTDGVMGEVEVEVAEKVPQEDIRNIINTSKL